MDEAAPEEAEEKAHPGACDEEGDDGGDEESDDDPEGEGPADEGDGLVLAEVGGDLAGRDIIHRNTIYGQTTTVAAPEAIRTLMAKLAQQRADDPQLDRFIF